MKKKRMENPDLRSAIMRAVKGHDTTPEKLVRRLLRSIAPDYRVHCSGILGKPDIVYLGRKLAIFVHGCFWHGHHCKRGARLPKTNAAYWSAKIARNRDRDRHVRGRLTREGWRTLVIWECQLKNEAATIRRLNVFLGRVISSKSSIRSKCKAKESVRFQSVP